MNIQQAKARLMELSGNTYHSLKYEIHDHGNGHVNQECTAYLRSHGHFSASHWEPALQALEDAINGKPAISENVPLSRPIATTDHEQKPFEYTV